MAIVVWRGIADGVAQVTHVTPSEIEVGDTFTLTINYKTVTVTATDTTAASVVALFVTAIGASTHPEWTEITATAGTNADGDTCLVLTGPSDGKPFTVTGTTGDAGNLDVAVSVVQDGDPGANEKQRVILPSTVDGGTFTLTFDGQTTGAIAYNASAATVETALEALSNIDAGDVSVTGSGPWTVEFLQQYARADVALMTGNGASLTQSTAPYTVNVQTVTTGGAGYNEKQRITLPESTSGGTFTLTYDAQTTGGIAYNASAATVETALEALSNIASGDVTVTGSAGDWTVEFTGDLANTDVSLLEGDGSSLTGCGASSVTETVKGETGQNAVYRVDFYEHDTCKMVVYSTEGLVPNYTTLWVGARAAILQSALEDQIGVGNCIVTEVTAVAPYDRSLQIEFTGAWGSLPLRTPNYFRSGQNTGDYAVVVQAGSSTEADEVQIVEVTGATGGTFTLSFRGQTTSAITWGDTDITAELEALSTIGADNVSVTAEAISGGYRYTITFTEDLAGEDVPLVSVDLASTTGGYVTVTTTQSATDAIDEVQRVELFGGPYGGTFTLTYSGQTTAGIAYNASASTVETALENLSNIDDVTVTGEDGGPWVVTFAGTLAATDVAQMTGSGASLSGAVVTVGTVQSAEALVNELQQIALTGGPTGGTFTLTFDSQTTGAIDFDAPAASIQAALEAISSIDVGEISVSGSPGGPWSVVFLGGLGAQDVDPITGSGANLTGEGAQGIDVTEYVTGTGPHHFDNADNWSTHAVPVDDDDIVYEDSEVSCLYGLDQSSLTPASLTVRQSYTGGIGLPSKSGSYYEYRDQYLRIGDSGDGTTMVIEIGEGEGYGSQLVKIDTGDCDTNVLVRNTGLPAGTDPAFLWKGTHADSRLEVFKGHVGAGYFRGESCNVSELFVGYVASQTSDAQVWLGDSCVLVDGVQTGGMLTIDGKSGTDITSLLIWDGETTLNGTDGLDSLIMRGGRLYYNSTGTLGGAPSLSGEARLIFNQDTRTKTITNPVEIFGDDADVDDDYQVVSGLVIDYNETTRQPNLGTHYRLTRGTPA